MPPRGEEFVLPDDVDYLQDIINNTREKKLSSRYIDKSSSPVQHKIAGNPIEQIVVCTGYNLPSTVDNESTLAIKIEPVVEILASNSSMKDGNHVGNDRKKYNLAMKKCNYKRFLHTSSASIDQHQENHVTGEVFIEVKVSPIEEGTIKKSKPFVWRVGETNTQDTFSVKAVQYIQLNAEHPIMIENFDMYQTTLYGCEDVVVFMRIKTYKTLHDDEDPQIKIKLVVSGNI